MKNTAIEWADHTFNPWEGCTKVSPGCAHCYAEARNARFGGGEAPNWGKGAPRRRTSASNWNQPRKWNEEAGIAREAHWPPSVPYERPRVFCASLADWLDDEVPAAWLRDLLDLIALTPNLNWLLLTKRPQNWLHQLARASSISTNGEKPEAGMRLMELWINGKEPTNIWVGTTVEDQARANERIPHLLSIPARVHFLSCEPLLGSLNIHAGIKRPEGYRGYFDWVICGGESGPGARPMHIGWARSLRNQCSGAGVPFLFKQWGEWYPLGDCHGSAVRVDRVEIDGQLVSASRFHDWKDGFLCLHIGKKIAGRKLDGVEHNGFPVLP
jgi:protein gp37